jgi:hypothetical protein
MLRRDRSAHASEFGFTRIIAGYGGEMDKLRANLMNVFDWAERACAADRFA